MGADEASTLAQLKTLYEEVIDSKISEYGDRARPDLGLAYLTEESL